MNESQTNTREGLLARLAEQEKAGLHGDVRSHEWLNRPGEVTSIPNESVLRNPDPVLASAVDRNTGLPVDLNAPGADFTQIILTVPTPTGMVAMSAAAAVQMGILKQMPDAPAGAPAGTPVVTSDADKTDADKTDEPDLEQLVAEPVFNEQDNADLREVSQILMNAGLQPNAVALELIGGDPAAAVSHEGIIHVANATKQTPEQVVEWIDELADSVNDRLVHVFTELGYDAEALLAASYESDLAPANRAFLSVLNSGSLVPLVNRVVAFLNAHPEWKSAE